MAIYRQLHVSFWQDPFVLDLTPEEKYFYVYLMTNSKTKQCGIYELPYRIMETETGYNRETVTKLLNRFIEYKKVLYHEPTKEIILLNWLKYNSMKSPKVRSCVEKEISEVKYKPFVEVFLNIAKDLGYSIDTVSIDWGEELITKNKEQEKEKDSLTGDFPKAENPHSDFPYLAFSNSEKDSLVQVERLPSIQKPTALVFCQQGKKTGLTTDDVNCLGLLFKIHTPAAIQKEILKAFERIRRKGKVTLDGNEITDPKVLPIRYIYNSMKNWTSLRRGGFKGGGNRSNPDRTNKDYTKGAGDLFA